LSQGTLSVSRHEKGKSVTGSTIDCSMIARLVDNVVQLKHAHRDLCYNHLTYL
jgi:hypothetical protein